MPPKRNPATKPAATKKPAAAEDSRAAEGAGGRAARQAAHGQPQEGAARDVEEHDPHGDAPLRPDRRPEGGGRQGAAEGAQPPLHRATGRSDQVDRRVAVPGRARAVEADRHASSAVAEGRAAGEHPHDDVRERRLSAGRPRPELVAEDQQRQHRRPDDPASGRVGVGLRPEVREGGLAQQPGGRVDRLGRRAAVVGAATSGSSIRSASTSSSTSLPIRTTRACSPTRTTAGTPPTSSPRPTTPAHEARAQRARASRQEGRARRRDRPGSPAAGVPAARQRGQRASRPSAAGSSTAATTISTPRSIRRC